MYIYNNLVIANYGYWMLLMILKTLKIYFSYDYWWYAIPQGLYIYANAECWVTIVLLSIRLYSSVFFIYFLYLISKYFKYHNFINTNSLILYRILVFDSIYNCFTLYIILHPIIVLIYYLYFSINILMVLYIVLLYI